MAGICSGEGRSSCFRHRQMRRVRCGGIGSVERYGSRSGATTRLLAVTIMPLSGAIACGMSSNGTMPFHSCSPVQPGTGSQPLERGRAGTNARTRWPILPEVSPATTLWSISAKPRVPSYSCSIDLARSIGSMQSNDLSGTANWTDFSASAVPFAGDPTKGTALALKSVQFAIPDKSFDCMLPMLRAKSVEQLYEGTRGFALMDHNVVAGDTSGKIGHRVRALVPARPRSNGWLPVPGWTGEHEWNGMVPFEDMPHAIAPDGGIIVTANNRVVTPEREPYLSTDPMPPHRTRRIWLRLNELKRPSPEQMPAIPRDLHSIPAIEIRERLRAVGLPPETKELLDLILGWNGEMRGDSVAAAAYSAVRLELTKLALRRSGLDKTADSDFTKVAPGLFPEVQFWWTLPQLLRSNDESLLNGATWDGLLREAVITVSKS